MLHNGTCPHENCVCFSLNQLPCHSGIINAMKATSFGGPGADDRQTLADIDKHAKAAPSSPQDRSSAKKRSLFGKSKKANNQ